MKPLNLSTKNTFRNLPEDKRRRITGAAVREFAEFGYRRASVNRIVSEAGIAKGSLYQYFGGKEDLFLHVFGGFIELVKQTVKENTDHADRELFSRLRFVLQAGLKFIETHPDYFRLYTGLLGEEDIPHRAELLAKVRFFPIEYFEPLIKSGQEQGMIRADVSSGLLIFMIDAVLERFLMTASNARTGGSFDLAGPAGAAAVIEQIISVLEGGLAGSAG